LWIWSSFKTNWRRKAHHHLVNLELVPLLGQEQHLLLSLVHKLLLPDRGLDHSKLPNGLQLEDNHKPKRLLSWTLVVVPPLRHPPLETSIPRFCIIRIRLLRLL